MSSLDQFRLYAEYNRLMNQRLYQAAAGLSPEQLSDDRGAFFKSVLGTLNHILVADIIWLKRFGGHAPSRAALGYVLELKQPAALSTLLFDDLPSLAREREIIDQVIIDWIDALDETDLDGCLNYRNMAGAAQSKPVESLIGHVFLHQVHHRGQATTLISQFGLDFGETDILEIIEDCP